MTKTGHTPTPWASDIVPASDWGPAYVRSIVGPDGRTIRVHGLALSSGDEPEANADLIVRAVNSHDALVAALLEARATMLSPAGAYEPVINKIDAAIALAEGRASLTERASP